MSNSTTIDDEVALTDQAKPAATAMPAPATAKKKKAPHPLVERYKRPALIVAGLLALIVVLYYAIDSYTHEETDDAYVTGHLHNVAPRIAGVVTEVLVNDNQLVHEGDTLVKLDPNEYLALQAAAAANVKKTQADLDRLQPLIATHAIAPEDVDAATNKRDVDLAQAELAKLQIDYSTIKAPATGYIGRKNVEVGNRVSSGQTMLVVVDPDVWVVANFKETQLAHMHRGQAVKISIDSIPGKVFDGTIDSFSPATGNQFALLPADNSTGNFTKIVQRVPVKIIFNRDSVKGYEERIRAGLSAVVKVDLSGSKDSGPQ